MQTFETCLFSCLIVAIATSVTRCSNSTLDPSPFNENDLPGKLSGLKGKFFGKFIGSVRSLKSLTDHKFTQSKEPKEGIKFSFYNSRSVVKDIKFSHAGYKSDQLVYPLNMTKMREIDFDMNSPLVIMIGGYRTGDTVEWMDQARDNWLKLGDVNLLLVTWKKLNSLYYSRAVERTPLVARQIVVFLHYLAELNGFRLMEGNFTRNIKLIGHSLGAHIAGFVGKDLGGQVGRIIGLDPAGPSFDRYSPDSRLDRSDASLVEIIHSNMGTMKYTNAWGGAIVTKGADKLFSNDRGMNANISWFGIEADLGHMNYYANDGKTQPGCNDRVHICDHSRASWLYVDMLSYELNLRSMNTTKNSLDANRLMAFAADSYDSFNNGNNWYPNCKSLVLDRKGPLNKCSVPLNLLASPEELKNRLKNLHPVDPTSNEFKFFFKTGSKPLSMGDHYLLRIKLDKSQSIWDDRCLLNVTFTTDNKVHSVEANRNLVTDDMKEDNFFGIAIPFINEHQQSRDLINQIFTNKIDYTNLGDVNNPIYKILPTQIRLAIREVKLGIIATFKKSLDQIKEFFRRRNDKHVESLNCILGVESMEVYPVTGYETNIVGSYKSNLDNTQAQLINHETYANLAAGEVQFVAPFEENPFQARLENVVVD